MRDAGEARSEGEARTQLTRFWPAQAVWVFLATGPTEASPWRGYFFQPFWNEPFEIAREQLAPDQSRIVLRTSRAWLLVQEWRETSRDDVSLVFRLNYAPATADDVAILTAALSRLGSIRGWDRNDDRNCTNDDPGRESLFCMLSAAVEARMGRYHHYQPALDLVRAVISERWRGRYSGHPLMDFNNHPATTIEDIRTALELALASARTEAAFGK